MNCMHSQVDVPGFVCGTCAMNQQAAALERAMRIRAAERAVLDAAEAETAAEEGHGSSQADFDRLISVRRDRRRAVRAWREARK